MNAYTARDRERFVGEDPAQKRADRDDFARDRARVLHSAALRRLAAKTQVVQPGRDDFSRNRLTHSLEVAQIGREFGGVLGCNADVVDMACLAHDLGHPPFGHNGERALDEVARDIGGFEGNAQTFRILTRLEAKRSAADGRSVGLNLTRACLDAATKYPWRRGDHGTTGKFGCYDDDALVFDWVREDVPRRTPHRLCVEAQVMDWSDDVAYSVHDVEDGITAGLIDLRALHSGELTGDLAQLGRRLYAPDLPQTLLEEALTRVVTGVMPTAHHGGRQDVAALKDMTSRLIGRFVGAAEQATRAQHDGGALTRYDADVVIPDDVRAEVVGLKAVAAHFVMLTDDRVTLLTRQRALLRALVEAYRERPDRLDPMYAEDLALAADDAAALRVVVDQVAALTDPRATELAHRWT